MRARPLLALALLSLTLAITSALTFAAGGRAQHAPSVVGKAAKEARALIDAALQALDNKDTTAAADALERALLIVRDASPLVIEKAVVVSAPPEGLGVFIPAVEGRVRDRQIWLYVEVSGFGRRSLGPDTWEVELSVTGDFFLDDGSSIGTMSLGKHGYRTHTPHAVTFFGPNMKLSDKAPAGAYQIDLTVTDAVTKKQAKKRVGFIIPAG